MDLTTEVIDLVASVLELPASAIAADSSMEKIAEWDSVAQLNICMAFQERFHVVMDMTTIAQATSISALVALLP